MIREAANQGHGSGSQNLSLEVVGKDDLEMSMGNRVVRGGVSFSHLYSSFLLFFPSPFPFDADAFLCDRQRPTRLSIKITNTEELTRDCGSGSWSSRGSKGDGDVSFVLPPIFEIPTLIWYISHP
jgi:hypothetical protein